MRRWALALLTCALPLASPLGCGSDDCLRNSDCPADQMCSASQCVLRDPPTPAAGGDGEETSSPVAGSATGGGSGSTNGGGSGTAGHSGSAAGEEPRGGAAGEAGTSGSGGATDEGGAGGAFSVAGAR